MGLFSRSKMSKDAGTWAAKAMGCMVFADGEARDAEVEAARGQVSANPVLKESLGPEKGEKLFNDTVAAIGSVIGAMLPTYETELAGLAAEIDNPNEKNFALATVIAVALGDRTLSDGEYNMLVRFRDMLGATIPLPQPGDFPPAEYRRAAAVTPGAEAGQAASGAEQQAAAAATEQAGGADAVTCPLCGQPTQHYEGYGHWCQPCQRYAEAATQGEAAAADAAASQQAAEASAAASASAQAAVMCGSCGKATQFYEGYGYWCNDCQQYTQA